jgi:hypothetical protein
MADSTTNSGLTATYDGLRTEVAEAVKLRDRLVRRGAPWPRRWPVITAARANPTAKLVAAVQSRMVSKASRDDQRHRLFSVVTAPYWVEVLADHCRQELGLTPSLIKGLSAIHDARQGALLAFFRYFRLGTIVGVVIAAFGFIASRFRRRPLKNSAGHTRTGGTGSGS